MKRTPTIQHDGSELFEVYGTVTKAWTDAKTGQRFLRGVVSGVTEDADGERVSARAIARMAAQSTAGGVIKATASHDQDWLTEFGDVVALQHDRDHNELATVVALPPAGDDAIADKAYKRAQKGDLGWSIGGKLRKSYFEVVPGELGKAAATKRRHVLDDIDLRHVCLTKKPSYRQSFAQVVAKTADLDAAPNFADEDLYDEPDDCESRDATTILKRATEDLEAAVMKAKTEPPGGDEKDPDAEAEQTAADADPNEDPDASTPSAGDTSPGTQQRTDAQAAEDLPQADGQRHLACPKCGTEFAAPLPDDLQPNEVATKPDDEKPPADTAKTTNKEYDDMAPAPLSDSLALIKRAASGGAPEVAKSTVPEPTPPTTAPTVTKTDEELSETERLIAASHQISTAATAELGEEVAKALGGMRESVDLLVAKVSELPQGRRSVAKRGGNGDPPPERDLGGEDGERGTDLRKTATEATTGAALLKCSREALLTLTDEEISERTETFAEAMRVINKRDRGIG